MQTKSKIILFTGIVGIFLVTAVVLGSSASATNVPPPVINSAEPKTGTTMGGTSVTLTGENLGGLSSISFGNSPATIISHSDSQIVVKTPSHEAGQVDINITAGHTATFKNMYTYLAPPIIESSQPGLGSTAGKTKVKITGQHFTGVTSVTFGGTAAQIQSSTDTQIIVNTGAHAAGSVDIKINGEHGTFIYPASYTYTLTKK